MEEAPEVSGHPRELLNKVMVTVDRCIARRETPEGRKLAVLDLHSKVSLLLGAIHVANCGRKHENRLACGCSSCLA